MYDKISRVLELARMIETNRMAPPDVRFEMTCPRLVRSVSFIQVENGDNLDSKEVCGVD